MHITLTTQESPEAIVRIIHVLTRQDARIQKITITSQETEQLMDIIITPHDNSVHIIKQIEKLHDVTSVNVRNTLHELTLS